MLYLSAESMDRTIKCTLGIFQCLIGRARQSLRVHEFKSNVELPQRLICCYSPLKKVGAFSTEKKGGRYESI